MVKLRLAGPLTVAPIHGAFAGFQTRSAGRKHRCARSQKEKLQFSISTFPCRGNNEADRGRPAAAETFTFSAGSRRGRTFITAGIYTAAALIHTLR